MANTFSVDQLYNAIRSAETDMLDTKQWGHNRWRRTSSAPPAGSTAFGPVQLTGRRVKDKKFKDKDLQNYADRFMTQAMLFNIHGNETAMKGYDPRLGYSNINDPNAGVGMLTSKKDKLNYEQLSKKLMERAYKRQGNNLEGFIKDWRHGHNYTGPIDQDYTNKVKDYLKKNP